MLDTFSEGASSAIQLARRSQNTLTCYIFRRSLISHPACQKKPEHTHFLDTFSEGASSAIQLARRGQNTLTPWTHFQKERHQPFQLCQKRPEHTHMLDTFLEGAPSAIQLARRSQN